MAASAKPAEIDINGAKAYIVVAGVVTSKAAGHPLFNKGAFTFTLRQVSGEWKITSQTWTNIWS